MCYAQAFLLASDLPVAAAVLLLLTAPKAFCQDGDRAPVKVIVLDQSGAPIPGAIVGLRKPPALIEHKLAANANGELMLRLTNGNYVIEANSLGFRQETQRIEVIDAASQEIHIVLRVWECTQCVMVTAILPSWGPSSEPFGSYVDADHLSMFTRNLDFWNILARNFKLKAAGPRKDSAALEEIKEGLDWQVTPTERFDLSCDITDNIQAGGIFVSAHVEFLVAPADSFYRDEKIYQLIQESSWRHLGEMSDPQPILLSRMKLRETRHVVFKDLDLAPVLGAFPMGNADNLWPWLMRVKIHARTPYGAEMDLAERTIRIWPNSARVSLADRMDF